MTSNSQQCEAGLSDEQQHKNYDAQDLVSEMVAAADESANDAANDAPEMLSAFHDNQDDIFDLGSLTENVRDQTDVERDITFQANAVLIDAEDKRDQQRIEKLHVSLKKLESQKQKEQQKLQRSANNPYLSRNVRKEIERLEVEIGQTSSDIENFKARIEKRHSQLDAEEAPRGKSKKLPGESHREYLIRTGKITPFANIGGPRTFGAEGELANLLLDAEEEAVEDQLEQDDEGPKSHQLLRRPGFEEQSDDAPNAVETEFSLRPRKKRRLRTGTASSDEFDPDLEDSRAHSPVSVLSEDDEPESDSSPRRHKGNAKSKAQDTIDLTRIDDGDESIYKKRLADWVARRSRARARRLGESAELDSQEHSGIPEWFLPSPDHADYEFGSSLKIPGDIHPSLFAYQRTGVQWLAELYSQKVGGIVGDEMGLGKTGTYFKVKLHSKISIILTL
jgi:DNA excision repair protein ERCC-6